MSDPKATLWELDKLAAEESLAEFIRQAWRVIEPGQPYIHGWHIDAICEHLEAITNGVEFETDGCDFRGGLGNYGGNTNRRLFNRFLANVPPGMMKSLSVNVFWPSWEWGPRNMPYLRYVCASHAQHLAIRDATKMRRLVASEWYQERWGDRVKLTSDQNEKKKFENTATGFREAAAFESLTGSRGDRVIIDDPHSVDGAASDAMRQSVVTTFLEAIPTRLNNPISSAIVVIMQRLHEDDVSGVILRKGLGYEHLCLPMEFDPSRRCETSIGFVDPREEDGELLFPERFPASVVARDKHAMGPYAVAGQFQQSPSPRGGGIIKREWWRTWDADEAQAQGVESPDKFPAMELIVASLDPAYTEKQENDPSGFTIWGLWRDKDGNPRLMLMNAWAKRLEIHGPEVMRIPGESDRDYLARAKTDWGLVEWVVHSCTRFKVDRLLIEAKASGLSVAQEIRRLHRNSGFSVTLVNPGAADKVARAYSVQPAFSNGQIYAPDRTWADEVITECSVFPKGAHDDRVDSTVQAVTWFRVNGLLQRPEEITATFLEDNRHKSPTQPIYDV